ncbi:response regulator [Cellvibrio japonicus]|uniref:Response regulator n=1 Tax=Cellvibrio japonicus (strain Ueda107) TaxID=498211 RepID=B3PGP6_CELJU|nr:two-component system response regulator [Cellvibrio japonicus]ACE82900.1 response regulator [Cellvibrio japonicus Ueda107]QEI12391.1 two-component system response regulator [Cellvibrio japonicus]QEI15964.1 two-component system response regulator [Cellvibrio japonicus]QEI19543.1 two-component system response regulator [Cellvibrio japonicus]
MTPHRDSRPKLLIVDDEPLNLQVLRQILQQDYQLIFARDGEKAIALAQSEQPQLILLDIMMPGITGLETCSRLKQHPLTQAIPVIFITALADDRDETEGFAAGCVDYITKPVSAPIVLARVKAQLSLVSAEILRETRLQVIHRLGRAAEYKDNETGLHVIRMSHFAREIALAAGMGIADAEELFNAAPMHDVGKMGIPDAILQKPGKLTPEEWDIMKQHARIGAEIIGEDSSSLLQMARRIALYHHEKWDGSGYPQGLAGEAIPMEARIVALADVFDALTSKRPYKEPWSIESTVAYIKAESARHFDPELVDCFIKALPNMLEIRSQFLEPE